MNRLHNILINEIKRNITEYNIVYSRQHDFYIFFLNYEDEIYKRISKNRYDKYDSFYLDSKFYKLGDWHTRITYETQNKVLILFKIDFTDRLTMIMNRFRTKEK